MKRVDHVESARSPIGDPFDAIVALANEVGATSIGAEAKRVAARLDRARLHVVVVGGADLAPPVVARLVGDVGIRIDPACRTSFRFARAPHARVTFRDGSTRVVPITWCDGLARASVEAIEVLVDAPLLRRGVCVSVGATPASDVVVDASCTDDLDRTLASITELAIECGAARVEDHAALHHKQLCSRLGNHLYEHHRALVRSPAAMLDRINALAIARTLAESVFEARSLRPDPVLEELTSWLAVERTKFLMSTKADALLALDERLAQSTLPRHQLRTAAAAASHAIAVELLAQLWRTTSARAEISVAALSKRLLADLDAALGELGESVSLHALTGFNVVPIRGLRRDLEWPVPTGIVAQIVDRFSLASRRRIQSVARDDLVGALASGSRSVIARVLSDYDDASRAIERRFCELLDSALQSMKMAAELAQAAQQGGADDIARARNRIAQWSIALDDIMSRLA